MFPEETQSGSKTISIFIAVLALMLIVGGISWLYYNSKSNSSESNLTTSSSKPLEETTVAPEPTIKTAPTDITTAINQLDKELTTIGLDENSDDDTVDL